MEAEGGLDVEGGLRVAPGFPLRVGDAGPERNSPSPKISEFFCYEHANANACGT